MKNIVYDLGILQELESSGNCPHGDPLEEALFLRHKKRLRKAISSSIQNTLTPKQRQAVLLYYGEKKTMTEIAAQLGIGRPAVSRLMARARARLKEALGPYLEG